MEKIDSNLLRAIFLYYFHSPNGYKPETILPLDTI